MPVLAVIKVKLSTCAAKLLEVSQVLKYCKLKLAKNIRNLQSEVGLKRTLQELKKLSNINKIGIIYWYNKMLTSGII